VGAVTGAGARAATVVGATGTVAAETATGSASSLPAGLGSEFQGICEHAAASMHVAAAAASLVSFSVNGLAFPSAKAAMVPMLSVGVKEVGDSEGLFSLAIDRELRVRITHDGTNGVSLRRILLHPEGQNWFFH
jgi:hypothetical protein